MQLAFGHQGKYKPPGTPRYLSDRAPPGLLCCVPFYDSRWSDVVFGLHGSTRYERQGGSGYYQLRSTAYGMGAPAFYMTYQFNSLPVSAKYTVEAIFTTTGAPADQSIAQYGFIYGEILINAGKIRFRSYNGSVYINLDDVSSVAAATYYHVIGTSDGANACLYINGFLVATSACVTATSSGVSQISQDNDNNGLTFLMASFAKASWLARDVTERFINPYGFLAFPEDDIMAMLVGATAVDVLMAQAWM